MFTTYIQLCISVDWVILDRKIIDGSIYIIMLF